MGFEVEHPELAARAREVRAAQERHEQEQARRAALVRERCEALHIPADTVVCVLWCRLCDPELMQPLLFGTAEHRGRWAGQHTRQTGHDSWHSPDLRADGTYV
jgi:hypothetical protein